MISRIYKMLMLALLLVFPFGVKAEISNTYNIYMALWNGCDDACIGFQEYLVKRGVKAEFILRDAKRDVKSFEKFIDEVENSDVDLVVTWGTVSAIAMFGNHNDCTIGNYITDVPGVFMVVSQPVEVGLVKSELSSERNITGVINIPNIETQITKAYSYIPFKKLGVVYNPLEQNSIVNIDALRNVAKLKDFTLVEEEVVVNDKGEPMADSLEYLVYKLAERGADMIYIGVDAFVNDNIEIVSKAALKRNIPLFSVAEKNVKSSKALYSVSHHYYNIGQLAAKKAYKILVKDINPREIRIDSPKTPSMIINMKWAKKLGLFPPIELLSTANLID